VSNAPQNREPQTQVEQAAYVVERVQSLGIRIHPTSRLMLMLQTLEREQIDYDDRRFPIALESIRDMYQLRLIVDQMEVHRENPKFRASVVKLLKDAALPQHGSTNTPGRDTQFELWLAAICLRAGLLPVDYDEPDITCTVEELKFGIAAKRLKSLDRFQDRVKDGAHQVRRAKLPGIIALDLTMARNPDNQPITSGLQSQLSVMIGQAKNRQFFEEYETGFYRWVGSGVRAVLVFEFTLRVSPDSTSWIHEGMMCWFPTTHYEEQAERELALFQKGFLQGIPYLEDLTAE
jgi:hypothetical protein